MTSASAPPAITTDELTAVVRRALDAPDATLSTWRATPLVHRVINGVTGSLQRISGEALVGGERRAWSVVLKVVQTATSEAAAPFAPSDDPRHWNYWRREPLLYASGLLDGFPDGLKVPRCLGTSEPVDGSIWLWLEAIAGVPAREWPPERYGLAARRLGQWQGGFAAGARPLPDTPWLSEGWLRAWVPDERGAALDLVRDPAAWQHPLLHTADPTRLAAAVDALWADRDALLGAIERLPLTFCHRDLWSANLFARHGAAGQEEIVLIDWFQSGNGALADDVANLAFDSVWMFGAAADDIPAFARLVLDDYCLGLRDAGWRGDDGAVRATFAAIAALRFGLLAGSLLAFARDEARHATWERRYGLPIAEIVARRVAVITHALALADQGRALLRR